MQAFLSLVARRWWRAFGVVMLVVPLVAWKTTSSEYTVRAVLQVGPASMSEVFFARSELGFTAEDSLPFRLRAPGGAHQAQWVMQGVAPLAKMRIDPPAQLGRVSVSSLVLTGPAGEQRWTVDELKVSANPDLAWRSSQNDQAVFEVVGVDPQLVLDVSSAVGTWTWRQWADQLARTGLWVLSLWALLEGLVHLVRHRREAWRKQACIKASWARLDVFAAQISEPSTLVFKASSVAVLGVLLALALVFVALKLHQSSIGRWDNIYGKDTVERWVDWGTPKAIRSDEWNTQTPWVLNQVQRGQAIRNANIGGAESAFVASTPVSGWVKWAQPKFWGFSFLDLERGFSWVWAYKLFGLLASFFLLLLFLTRGHTLLSLSGALWILGSSFVQWWYSSNLPEMLIGFAFGVTGALYVARAQRTGGLWFGAFLLVYAVCTLLLHVYPAFIIPLAYLGGFICVGVFWEGKGYTVWCTRVKERWLAVVLSVTVASVFVWAWASVARDTIELMTQTVYPGKRYDLGGGMPWDRLWYGFFEAIRVREDEFPFPPSNASEAASFLLLFPLLFLLMKPFEWFKPNNRLVLVLMVYALLTLAWMALPLPLALRQIVAAMGWGMSASNRAEVGLGVASILTVVVWMSQNTRTAHKNADTRWAWWPCAVWGLATGGVLLWGLWLRGLDPTFFYVQRLVLATCLVALVIGALVKRHAGWLLLAVTLFVAPSMTINPVQSGLGSVLKKPLLSHAHALGHGPEDRWAVMGNFVFSQGLKARGLDVVTGTHFAPNKALIRVLDPDEQYRSIWNRYAHVTFMSDPSAKKPVFELVGMDQYTVRFNVCGSEVLKALGVRLLAYTEPVPSADRGCLNLLPSGENESVVFFDLK